MGVCFGCSMNCHVDHEIVELFDKRDFRFFFFLLFLYFPSPFSFSYFQKKKKKIDVIVE